MTSMRHDGVVEVFLEGANVVAGALGAPAVAEAWNLASVLEDQSVGGLAGHLARGGVWVVADYLDNGVAHGTVDFPSPGEYFRTLLGAMAPEDHQAIRRRGAEVAADGHAELCRALGQRLDALGPRLRSLEAGHLIAVTGRRVMRLDDYLTTRIVEQVVHLDDLARSVGREPWPMPAAATDAAISIGIDIARHRSGSTALFRALYRRGWSASIFPVL